MKKEKLNNIKKETSDTKKDKDFNVILQFIKKHRIICLAIILVIVAFIILLSFKINNSKFSNYKFNVYSTDLGISNVNLEKLIGMFNDRHNDEDYYKFLYPDGNDLPAEINASIILSGTTVNGKSVTYYLTYDTMCEVKVKNLFKESIVEDKVEIYKSYSLDNCEPTTGFTKNKVYFTEKNNEYCELSIFGKVKCYKFDELYSTLSIENQNLSIPNENGAIKLYLDYTDIGYLKEKDKYDKEILFQKEIDEKITELNNIQTKNSLIASTNTVSTISKNISEGKEFNLFICSYVDQCEIAYKDWAIKNIEKNNDLEILYTGDINNSFCSIDNNLKSYYRDTISEENTTFYTNELKKTLCNAGIYLYDREIEYKEDNYWDYEYKYIYKSNPKVEFNDHYDSYYLVKAKKLTNINTPYCYGCGGPDEEGEGDISNNISHSAFN